MSSEGLQGVKFYMQAVLEQNYIAAELLNRTSDAFGKKIGIIAKVFGCWHKELSRPFTDKNKNKSYRACLHCGARKSFDAATLQTFGPFYYPPAISPVSNNRRLN
jgi:hypothetical protein